MLIQIDILNFATIREIHLSFDHGSTMITGETGAGKSIFIEAIDLALGGRASPNLIRTGKDKAEIVLSFDITNFPHVIAKLKSFDLYEANECIIRRVITSDGRSKSYVNGTPQNLHFVKLLGEWLFHLHSQHDQQVLLKSEHQRDIVDRYGDLLPLVEQVKSVAKALSETSNHIETLKLAQEERDKRMSYLAYQLRELESLSLAEKEWENIEIEHKRLANAETILKQLQALSTLMTDEEDNLLVRLNIIRKNLESLHAIEPKTKAWVEIIQSVAIQLNELSTDIKNHLITIDIDQETSLSVELRMSEIHNLARKYKTTPQELNNIHKELSSEYQSLEALQDNLQDLEKQKKAIIENYFNLAKSLTEGRKKSASELEKKITQTIRSLSLPYAEFKIEFEEENEVTAHGQEKIHFLIKTNPEQHLQPLARVISGGELSRLSLAAHLALAHRTAIPTLVFDEVDTGLSGATAEKIGRLLHQLGKSYQVFCITHLAQVAACGHHHLLVEKSFVDNVTYTNLRPLKAEEKTYEIARLLGGEKVTKKTLDHAREVLQMEIIENI